MTPHPRISTPYPLSTLLLAWIFSKLDLQNAYHLVRIHQGGEWKTAFNTPLGHFDCLVMPFGLNNTPAVFQSLVIDIDHDMSNRFIYIDNILVFSETRDEQVQDVHLVLHTFSRASCLLRQISVTSLCHFSPSWCLWCSRDSSRQIPPR